MRNQKYKRPLKTTALPRNFIKVFILPHKFKEYPDMMTTQQLRQITGHSISVIILWCKDEKVRYVRSHNTYFIQKQSTINYLYEREMQN